MAAVDVMVQILMVISPPKTTEAEATGLLRGMVAHNCASKRAESRGAGGPVTLGSMAEIGGSSQRHGERRLQGAGDMLLALSATWCSL
jgi:carbon monoxide dehydrogenase subunit G